MKKPKKRWAFDTEDDSKGHPFLFNFFDGEHHETFIDPIEALDFACGQRGAEFWACNLEYDINNLFKGHHALLSYCFAGSKLIFAELPEDSIRFLDTFNHWKISVKTMGERIGLPKLEMRHTGLKRATPQMIRYCRRDTEIVWKFVDTMAEKYESIGARLRTTIAATTMDHFERNFYGKLKHPFEERDIDFFHTGYYGGRTEVFYTRPVAGKIFYHDVNSLYPSVQKHNSFPLLNSFFKTDNVKNFEGMGIADVFIKSPKDLQLPYLPAKVDKKLVFPLGTWRGVYTFFEIERAKRLGYKVLECGEAFIFPESFSPFDEFITTLYTERQKAKLDGDDLLQTVYKDLMNHGYGKFAQRNQSTRLLPIRGNQLRGGDTLFGELLFRRETIKYPRFANCVWASHVTAYARDLLYRALSDVAARGGRLLYCDTDSVIYESKKQLFPDSDRLGEFKLEGIYDYAHFRRPKLYCLRKMGDKTKIYRAKGVPRGEARDFFESGRATFKKPNKLRESLRRNQSKKTQFKMIPNFWEDREKEVRGKYTKRIVLKNGETRPLILN